MFKITHNDIKPSNILLKKRQSKAGKSANHNNVKGGDALSNYIAKISDFGTSIQVAGGHA